MILSWLTRLYKSKITQVNFPAGVGSAGKKFPVPFVWFGKDFYGRENNPPGFVFLV
jgi:hypothetical protein